MLEAPEALLIAGQISETLTCLRVTEVVAGETPHKFAWFNGDPAEYPAKLCGLTLTGARAQGGMVEISFGDTTLTLTDGVNLTYIPPGGDLPRKHQLLIGFDDESCVTASVRMYGGIVCFPGGRIEGTLADYYNVARDRPQVMSQAFTLPYFLSLMEFEGRKAVSLKAALATEQRIPGLGNGVLQDILYEARLHPRADARTLADEEKRRLYDSLKETLAEIYRQGGRNSETDLFGTPGGYRPSLGKETAGKECRRCGSVIVRENYMGGSVYYCPGCQRK